METNYKAIDWYQANNSMVHPIHVFLASYIVQLLNPIRLVSVIYILIIEIKIKLRVVLVFIKVQNRWWLHSFTIYSSYMYNSNRSDLLTDIWKCAWWRKLAVVSRLSESVILKGVFKYLTNLNWSPTTEIILANLCTFR